MRRFCVANGETWTTDKDGIVAALLAAEITARAGRDPGEVYGELTRELGTPANGRVEAHATPAQKKILSALSPEQVKVMRSRAKDREHHHERAGQWSAHRRSEGFHRDGLVCGAPVGHGGHLQDLR